MPLDGEDSGGEGAAAEGLSALLGVTGQISEFVRNEESGDEFQLLDYLERLEESFQVWVSWYGSTEFEVEREIPWTQRAGQLRCVLMSTELVVEEWRWYSRTEGSHRGVRPESGSIRERMWVRFELVNRRIRQVEREVAAYARIAGRGQQEIMPVESRRSWLEEQGMVRPGQTWPETEVRLIESIEEEEEQERERRRERVMTERQEEEDWSGWDSDDSGD